MLSSNSSDLETNLDLDPDSEHRSSPKYGRFFSSASSTITNKTQTSNRQRSEVFQKRFEKYLKYRDHPMFRLAGEFKIDIQKELKPDPKPDAKPDAKIVEYTVVVLEHRIFGELVYANNEGKITDNSESFKKKYHRNM